MKKSLIDIVNRETNQFCIHLNPEHFYSDAQNIATELRLDRANVSRQLNRLWRDGSCLKVDGRPTFFVSLPVIADHYPGISFETTYDSMETFLTVLQGQTQPYHQLKAFDGVIGSRIMETMYDQTQALCDYFDYPANAYHVTIRGEKGSGKMMFCDAIYHYVKSRLFSTPDVHQQTIGCDQMSFDAVLDKLNAFQDKEGVFVLHRIDALEPRERRQLLLHVEALLKEPCMRVIVFTTSTQEPLDASFYSQPILIPPFEQRHLKDRMSYVIQYFYDESVKIDTPILLRRNILNCFLTSSYEHNLYSVLHEIRSTCIRAFTRMKEQQSHFLDVSFEDLSDHLLTNIRDVRHVVGDIERMYEALETSRFYINPQEPFTLLERLSTLTWSSSDQRLDHANQSMKASIAHLIEGIPTQQVTSMGHLERDILSYFEMFDTNESMHPYLESLSSILAQWIKNGASELIFDTVNVQQVSSDVQHIMSLLSKAYHVDFETNDLLFVEQFITRAQDAIQGYEVVFLAIPLWQQVELSLQKMFPKLKHTGMSVESLKHEPHRNLDVLTDIIKAEYKGKGVVLVSDGALDTHIIQSLREEVKFPIETISNVTPQMMEQIQSVVSKKGFEMTDLRSIPEIQYSDTLEGILTEGLRTSLKFFDAAIISENLVRCYQKVIQQLERPFSFEQCGHFVYEGAFAYERLILNKEKRFPKLAQAKKQHQNVFEILSDSLSAANHLFDQTLSDHEMMYLTQLFIETS